jgi:hypothetical protein
MEQEASFDRLVRDLDLAAAAYSDTCKELEAARRQNTLALNKLNEAQKAFDKAAARFSRSRLFRHMQRT